LGGMSGQMRYGAANTSPGEVRDSAGVFGCWRYSRAATHRRVAAKCFFFAPHTNCGRHTFAVTLTPPPPLPSTCAHRCIAQNRKVPPPHCARPVVRSPHVGQPSMAGKLLDGRTRCGTRSGCDARPRNFAPNATRPGSRAALLAGTRWATRMAGAVWVGKVYVEEDAVIAGIVLLAQART